MKRISNKKGKALKSPTSGSHFVAAPVKAKSIQAAESDATLTPKEQELLEECESDISENLQGAFLLGYRLEQIRDQRLYRADYGTFAAYCSKRWDFSKTHANRLIQAHLCEKHLKSIKDVEVYLPTKESQVRCICDLEPEKQVEVAHQVLETVGEGAAGAGDFMEAREKLYPKPKREAKAAKTEPVVEEARVGSKVVAVRFDTNLVSCQELHALSVNAYNTFGNSSKRNEVETALWKLKEGLREWADWQAKQLNQKEGAV